MGVNTPFQAVRDYPVAAVDRLLTQQDAATVNGSPVHLRSACDLASGHLDPWVLQFEESRHAEEEPRRGAGSLVRDLVEILLRRDMVLLRARTTVDAAIARLQEGRDLTAGAVSVDRLEWDLAGEVRPVWQYSSAATDSGLRPAFVHLHGGGFSAGTPSGNDQFLRLVAARSGAVVFDIDYSMLPERTYPQPVLEASAALRHIREHAVEWGLDTSRLIVGGASAGGNLAAATALMERDAGNHLALQVLYAPFLLFGGKQRGLKFTPVHVAPEHLRQAGPQGNPMSGPLVHLLYRAYRGTARREDPYMSPAHATDLEGVAPALMITSEMDPLHQSGEHYAGELARAGVSVRTIRYLGSKHETVSLVGYVPQAEAAALETAAAIASLTPARP